MRAEWRIVQARSEREIEAARALLERYAAGLPFSLDYQGFAAELDGLPAPYAPPGGRLLLARRRAEWVGTVGLKPLGPRVAEIKRLYVAPQARGSGIGRALLERALRDARQIGCERARLDSHRRTMTAAIALYRTLGFIEIPPYGPDLGGQIAFFEKDLRRRPPSQR